MQMEAAACVTNNSAYVSGIGASCKETWRWDSVGGWARCGDMVEGRRRHCATFVNSTSMYALGGFVDSTKTTLSSVEHFDTVKNKWTTVGKLVHAARNAGCASYKTSVYLFGGMGRDTAANKDVDLDCIQVFDTTTKQCSVLTQRLPRGERLLRAVLWETSVILMNNRTCLIFDLNHHNIQQRDQFKADVAHFGLVLNNQTLFVIGGGIDVKQTLVGK
jgi:N-acetylneuraminic acid mutarotase